MKLDDLVAELDAYFRVHEVENDDWAPAFEAVYPEDYWREHVEPGYEGRWNGLMVRGTGDVDRVVTCVFPSDRIVGGLEPGTLLFSEHPLDPTKQRHWFAMRRALVQFHRLVVPMREAVSSLMRREHSAVDEALYPYFQDVYDHVQRTSESVDSARDLVASVLDANLTEQSNQLNEITKKLASWAAIIAVPTAVTGFYGQNVPYPGFGTHGGFVAALVVMIVLAGGVYALLRSRDWL